MTLLSFILLSLLDNAVSYVQTLKIIPDDIIQLIKKARKSLLFTEGNNWMRKGENPLFDVYRYIYFIYIYVLYMSYISYIYDIYIYIYISYTYTYIYMYGLHIYIYIYTYKVIYKPE